MKAIQSTPIHNLQILKELDMSDSSQDMQSLIVSLTSLESTVNGALSTISSEIDKLRVDVSSIKIELTQNTERSKSLKESLSALEKNIDGRIDLLSTQLNSKAELHDVNKLDLEVDKKADLHHIREDLSEKADKSTVKILTGFVTAMFVGFMGLVFKAFGAF